MAVICQTEKMLLRERIVGMLPRLSGYAHYLSRDHSVAEDLVQDVCERALNRLEQVKDVSRLDSWLCRIMYTRWIDRLRRCKRQAGGVEYNDNLIAESVASQDGRDFSAVIDVRKALAQLPPDFRSAIQLTAISGYSYDEAAEILGVPAGTVASRVARARVQLASYFSKQEN